MSGDVINAFPLSWPDGWKRTESFRRSRGQFSKSNTRNSIGTRAGLTPADGAARVLYELKRLRIDRDDIVISSNLRTRLDGLPKDETVSDPGVAVYWRSGTQRRCMAIDRYSSPAHNLAAIAATLEALRAIERHGGGLVLDRAFTGFSALPAPDLIDGKPWHEWLEVSPGATEEEVARAYRLKISEAMKAADAQQAASRINRARDEGILRAARM